jgi:putative flippase GtrA
MSTEEFTSAVELPFSVRVRHAARQPHNWRQLLRFGAVGITGYLINLVVFAGCLHLLSVDYREAFVIAFVVSVVSNFWWNRHWTFAAKHQHPAAQAVRFFTISVLAQGFAYVILVALVNGTGIDKVAAQAIAVAAATPLSFIGQKLWTFKA